MHPGDTGLNQPMPGNPLPHPCQHIRCLLLLGAVAILAMFLAIMGIAKVFRYKTGRELDLLNRRLAAVQALFLLRCVDENSRDAILRLANELVFTERRHFVPHVNKEDAVRAVAAHGLDAVCTVDVGPMWDVYIDCPVRQWLSRTCVFV